MDLEIVHELIDGGLVALQLDASSARIGVRAPDLDIREVVGDTGFDDGVQDLGQQQRVDDVAAQLDGLGGHGFGSSGMAVGFGVRRPHG